MSGISKWDLMGYGIRDQWRLNGIHLASSERTCSPGPCRPDAQKTCFLAGRPSLNSPKDRLVHTLSTITHRIHVWYKCYHIWHTWILWVIHTSLYHYPMIFFVYLTRFHQKYQMVSQLSRQKSHGNSAAEIPAATRGQAHAEITKLCVGRARRLPCHGLEESGHVDFSPGHFWDPERLLILIRDISGCFQNWSNHKRSIPF